jgi:hypothetical protein
MGYEKKLALAKQSPSESHPYGKEKKKYRKRLNRVMRRLLKVFTKDQEV